MSQSQSLRSARTPIEDEMTVWPKRGHRRDRGVALSGQAAAFAAIGEPGEAATAAMQALGVARDAGSDRIINMVIPVATVLAPYRSIEAVGRLHAVLAESPGA
jgi:hypothetical protein